LQHLIFLSITNLNPNNHLLMQIRSAFKRKSQTFEDTLYNKKRRLLEKGIEILTSVYNLETYNPLLRNFDNITRWLNLTEMTTLKNRIDVLPKELGTLPFLQRLNLSHNCLHRYGWSWLKEIPIRKTLLFLDISNNSVRHIVSKISRQLLIKTILLYIKIFN